MVRSVARLRVLVIEDDPDTAGALRTLLACWGHDVVAAADPATAVALAATLGPAAAVIDVQRPWTDGFEVARELRKVPWGAAPALVAAIGPEERAVRLRAWEAGCTHFLPAPLDPGQLRAVLSMPAGRPGERGPAALRAGRF